MIVDDTQGPLGKKEKDESINARLISIVVVCCILKGGHQYFADLVNEIKKLRRNNGSSVQLSLEFIRVKSYTNDTSCGVNISLTDEQLKEFKGKVSYHFLCYGLN